MPRHPTPCLPLQLGSFEACLPSSLAKVLWMNLDRRTDRAEAQQQSLEAAGIEDFAERVPAVDGSTLDWRSAVGLWLTWYEVLCRIIHEAAGHECYLVVEDDAEYAEGFGPSIFRLLDGLDRYDPDWHACAVGFIRSKSRMHSLEWGPQIPKDALELDEILAIPSKLCGATAILVHGAEGAKEMLKQLFPIGADHQFDLKITLTLHDPQSTLRFFIAASPLASAPLSEAGDTDIQRIPPARRQQLKQEALARHRQGDDVKAVQPNGYQDQPPAVVAKPRAAEKAPVTPAASVAAPPAPTPMLKGRPCTCSPSEHYSTCCCRLAKFQRPRFRIFPQTALKSESELEEDQADQVEEEGNQTSSKGQLPPDPLPPLSPEEEELNEMRRLDKGVPHLRRAHGELAGALQRRRFGPRSAALEEEIYHLQSELEAAAGPKSGLFG
eukprot:s960_g11.t2